MLLKKIFLALLLISGIGANAQPNLGGSLDFLAGQFVKYIRSLSKEKVIVVTNKQFYSVGEIIWLKAWSVDSSSDKPIHASKNLFVDLVDEKDSTINQMLFDISLQKTDGHIQLPPSLKEGYYWLRAYTTNILKQDSNRIFVMPVYVLNPAKPNPHSLSSFGQKLNSGTEDTSSPKITFYPEGGWLISGTTATVAFTCTNAKGNPIHLSGYVTDTRNDTVARFKSSAQGLGKFSFDAYNPRKYFAHIEGPKNNDLVYPLPRINQFGSQLSVIGETDQEFRVRVSLGDSLYKKNLTTYILGLSKDNLCFASSGNDMYDVSVPKNNFPEGMATLFLFNYKHEIVSQRTIYIAKKSDSIAALTDKHIYSSREKVKLDINTVTNGDHPSPASLTVSVVDYKSSGENADDLLSENNNKQSELLKPEDRELTLLTQNNLYSGWSINADQLSSTLPSSTNADSGLLNIGGKVVTKSDAPIKSGIVNLFSKDNGIFKTDTTKNDGHFYIQLPDYDDGTQFQLKLTNLQGKGQEGKVIFDKSGFPEFKTPQTLKKGFDKNELTEIRKFKAHHDELLASSDTGKNLKPVTVTAAKQQGASYDTSKRVNSFSYIITSENLNNGDQNAIINAVTRVPGFNAGFSTMSFGSTSYGVQPLVVVDGVTMSLSTDVKTFLQTFDPESVDFIEILKGPQAAMYGMQGAGGVILINTTNERKNVSKINDKGFSTIYPKGYFKETGFPSPDYDKPQVRKSSTPDQRSTIYWNGNVVTDNNGKATLYFYTADSPTVYIISITGLTANGSLLTKKIKITVQ